MLKRKHIVIVAGSSGIGLEVARLAAERKARVTITGRDEMRLRRAVEDIPGPVSCAAFDAMDRGALGHFLSEAGEIDHLVSCLGDTSWGSFLQLDEKRAREVIEHKFWGQLAIVRAAQPYIGRTGSIILTAGTTVDRGMPPFAAAYSLTGNTMVEVLVKGLSAELAPLRINVVEPGLTRTPLFASMPQDERDEMFRQWAKGLPIGRIPDPREVALSYIHLMENQAITGERIRPDGGPAIRPA